MRDTADHAPTGSGALETALGVWLDRQLAAGATYREMHDALESLALQHLLARFDGKPTVLARETKMNRVTLRKKVLRLGPGDKEAALPPES